MAIGIIGNGFVGGAVASFFQQAGEEVRIYDTDPARSTHSLPEAASADFVFLCVPTPTRLGEQDLSIVRGTVASAAEHSRPDAVLVLKSTVLPGTSRSFGLDNLVFNPEFLTARTAKEDFANQQDIVLGGPSGPVERVQGLYARYWPDAEVLTGSWEMAELVKYVRNTFYALKVAHFNEVYDLCEALDVDYEVLREGALASGWINPMHTQVPGPDGRRGFGGACLPKDTQALAAWAESIGVNLSLLRQTMTSNARFGRDEQAIIFSS